MTEDNKAFCAAPWVHLFGFGDDKIYPCCKSSQPVGSVKEQSLKEIWNSDDIKKLRVNMLQGIKTSSCEVCYLNEARWGDSYRLTFNKRYQDILQNEITNTSADGTVDKFNLRYLDLRFSNLCNFKCIMCSGFYSTSWYKEEKQLKREGVLQEIADTKKERNFFYLMRDELPDVLRTVEKINFAGGEPFIVKEYLEVLDELIKQNKTDTEITFNTNLSILPDAYVEKLKKFTKITIRASLDGYGAKGEFIRKGLIWKKFIANRIQLSKELPHADIRIYCTVQVLNVYHVLELYKMLISASVIPQSPNKFHISFVETPDYYNIRTLDKNTKQLITNFYNNNLINYPDKIKNYLSRVIIYMNETDIDKSVDFKKITNELDGLRNQKTREIFPELTSYFDHINL